MENILYIDGRHGVTGDRLLAALLDAGLPLRWFQRLLVRAPIPPVEIRPHRTGAGLSVELRWARPHRRTAKPAAEIVAGVQRSALPPGVRRPVLRILRRLIRAEAQAHRCPPGRVLFHQLSAPDTLVYLIGVGAGLVHFRVARAAASPLLVGRRYQDQASRWCRAVGPATRRLTARWPVWLTDAPLEYTTPTGAAIVTTMAQPVAGWRGPARLVARGCGYPGPGAPPVGPVTVSITLDRNRPIPYARSMSRHRGSPEIYIP